MQSGQHYIPFKMYLLLYTNIISFRQVCSEDIVWVIFSMENFEKLPPEPQKAICNCSQDE